ncbi:MAG: hypothetical protein EOM20_12815 [Spartobacteria bacterium]|nr:hypothetical protein [Spartobacteria bacterium]
MKYCVYIVACLIVLLSGTSLYALKTIDDVRGDKPGFDMEEVDQGDMDDRLLTPLGRMALEMPDMKWRHAQTTHFVLHYERVTFARKVGRMGEFMHDYIGEELQVAEQQNEGRSHIFIFRDEKEWKAFLRTAMVSTEWAFSLVQGPTMFLQQDKDTTSSGSVLAHEMTHLVVNRYFSGTPPLWLNEGLAQWYEEFGYAAFKGIKKSKRPQFRSFKHVYPVSQILVLDTYPQTAAGVRAFYETSKYMVGLLMIKWPPEKIVPFTRALIQGADVYQALQDHYDLSLEEFTQALSGF